MNEAFQHCPESDIYWVETKVINLILYEHAPSITLSNPVGSDAELDVEPNCRAESSQVVKKSAHIISNKSMPSGRPEYASQ
ncbi:hypothetical protein GCM10009092_21850 [Bowmanella denitrificans]|uniref:Uncharacterized protein n=1 Tax=Bowmanella denitrificans TaxID=366582 RepID=A0ABN0X8F3_9ALTE